MSTGKINIRGLIGMNREGQKIIGLAGTNQRIEMTGLNGIINDAQ